MTGQRIVYRIGTGNAAKVGRRVMVYGLSFCNSARQYCQLAHVNWTTDMSWNIMTAQLRHVLYGKQGAAAETASVQRRCSS